MLKKPKTKKKQNRKFGTKTEEIKKRNPVIRFLADVQRHRFGVTAFIGHFRASRIPQRTNARRK